MGWGLGKLNPLSNTGINKKISNTVQTVGGLGLSLGTAGMSNKLTSQSAQESKLGQVSTVVGQVATAGSVIAAGGYALAPSLISTPAQGVPMASTIADTAAAPTIYDQLKGIVTDGIKTATAGAVNRATSPKPVPTVSDQFAGAAQSVPVWGWVLGALAIAGLVFVVARK